MATWPRTNQSPLESRRTAPPSGSVSSSISPTTSSMMSSTVTMPAVRPYSSMTTASELRWRLGVHDPLAPVVVLVLRDHEPRVARADAAAQRGLHVLGGVHRDNRR